jgi:lipopolysaccharide/colanic/teichoic acid biosynthesis glycosyltransferase
MINEHSGKLFLKERIFLFIVVKRSVDIISSVLFLTLLSPLLILISICIKLSSPGPILFQQNRVGLNNHQFKMFKFRSMYLGDNDKFLEENYPNLWEKYKKSDWKLPMSEDPRITPIGKIIRATSLDESPQFLNVLKGDMSLVGPRAYREDELCEYERKYPQTKKYIDIIRTAKPGITGLWQTSGRNNLSFEKRAELDANYIKNRSLRQEFFIILKTPFAMLSRW